MSRRRKSRDVIPAAPAAPPAKLEIPPQTQEAFAAVLGSGYVGSQVSSMLAGWNNWLGDPEAHWSWDAELIASRSWDLVQNDPHCRSMLEAVLQLTYGADGLRFKSLYQEDDAGPATDDDRAQRRTINESVRRASAAKRLDAGGQRTRKRIGHQTLIDKVVTGDGFAVRCWKPARPDAYQASCWRGVGFDRISNPDNRANDAQLWHGMEYDGEGSWVAVWIRNQSRFTINPTLPLKWDRVPVFADDGTRNVIHTFKSLRGERRGFSWFAPLMVLAKHLQQVSAAYVVAKRIQACHPLINKVLDPVKAAGGARSEALLGPNTRFEPGRVYYAPQDSDIVFPNWSFNGADYREFIDSQLRAFTACWGLPFQVVMQQLTDANLASSRAALDQTHGAAETFRQDQIEDVESAIDQGIIREDIVRGRITVPGDMEWDHVVRGTYSEPRRWSTDKMKDALAAKALIEIGVSRSTVYADLGLDFYEEQAFRAEEKELLDELPLPAPPAAPGAPPAPGMPPAPGAPPTDDPTATDGPGSPTADDGAPAVPQGTAA